MNPHRHDKSNQFDASEIVRRSNCELIIDGYNLLHVTRFKPQSSGEGELKRCREGLLTLLARKLPTKQYRSVRVVFDSDRAPAHLADCLNWQHLEVRFARDQNSADDLIALMIRASTAPKQLVVVSSDHRVQVAAQRRKAIAVDSDRWFDALLERDDVELAAERPDLSADELDKFRAAMAEPLEREGEPNGEASENPFPDGYFDDLDVDL